MNDLIPKRKPFIVLLAAIASVSLLYQVVKGWNALEFLLRVVIFTALALVMRRSAILVSQAATGSDSRSGAQLACWVLVAAALFAGLMMGA